MFKTIKDCDIWYKYITEYILIINSYINSCELYFKSLLKG